MTHPRRVLLRTLAVLTALWLTVLLRADAIDDYLESEMKKLGIPGLSLAVVQNGRLVKSAGYGLSDVETGVRATPESAFKVASISKPIIATAVMLLAQRGRLNLDDAVPQYLPDAPASWANITIRQLLSHTSGLVRDPLDYHPYTEQQPVAVIRSASSLPLQSKPGEKWSYSNIGYYILAEIITKASGTPWNDFIVRELFDPAGLTSTRLTSVPAIIPNRARGYEITPAGLSNAEDWIAVRPSGAYVSTVLDLARLDVFLDTQNPLDTDRRALMFTPARLLDGTTASYGLGWGVDSYLGQPRIAHGGQFPGFSSEWEKYPRQRLSIILLGNLGSGRVERLVPKLAGFYSSELAIPEFSAAPVPPADSFSAGKQGVIAVVARSLSRSAPDCVIELEVWDEANKPVHKEDRAAQNFTKGELKTYEFKWTPEKPGKYSVNLGIYGPKWNPGYLWSEKMSTITVK
jgi:CubicO group peptidase (beta-lactamase class C family)